MTDHSDLIAELRGTRTPGAELLCLRAASALSSQSLSLSEAREEIERLKGLVAGIRALSESDREALKTAIRRGTADDLNGRPDGDIIVKGCAVTGYVDPVDAANRFVDAIAGEIIAANRATVAATGASELLGAADWLEAVLAAYEAETRALPLGAANREKGDSTYNWRMSVVRDLRELATRLTNTSLER